MLLSNKHITLNLIFVIVYTKLSTTFVSTDHICIASILAFGQLAASGQFNCLHANKREHDYDITYPQSKTLHNYSYSSVPIVTVYMRC